MDIGRGQKSPYFMDQLDFVVGAWLFVTIFAGAWFWSTFTIPHALVVLILTPALHRIVNIIGYKMGKKDVPW